MIIKRKYYSEKEQTEDPKKKRKLAGAAGTSLIGMGGALTGGSKLLKKVQKDVEGLTAEQIKEKFPKLTEKQIKKYMRTATKPETLKKAGRLGYASMAAGAATLGASIYDKKKKAKEKEFTRADYKGLSKNGAKELREVRNNLADALWAQRNRLSKDISDYREFIRVGQKEGNNTLKKSAQEALDAASEILDLSRKSAQNQAKTARDYLLDKEANNKKNLKKAGKIGLGVAGTAALAVGGKKLYDKKRKAAKDDNTEK